MSESEQVEQRMNYTTYVAIDESCPFPSKVHVYRDQSKKTRTYVPERTCQLVDNDSGPEMHCTVCNGEVDDEYRYFMERWGYSRCPHCGARIEEE